ncbi:MAG: ethanolamine ammonia-lyase reactivating factor EutA [Euryarchaeota archaeon]|nr:ethanolamine ammonia-lyase reactivating factor EutA [Euryarchaeota archaeon]
MSERFSSVGIDIGTTTTQTVVSELTVEKRTNGVPKLDIVERTVCYRGEIHETPLSNPETVDAAAVVALVEGDLEDAGVHEIDTGAVIVTGETARTRNAEAVAHELAETVGEFVAATAGAALEAVLAGRGSGTAARAATERTTIMNVDIGGGTTNAAVFEGNTVRETRCLDVGGRAVRFADDGTVIEISGPGRTLADAAGVAVEPGKVVENAERRRLAATMADCIVDLLRGPPFDSLTRELTIGDLPEKAVSDDAVYLTGGVGKLVGEDAEPLRYGDMGVDLAAALRERIEGWETAIPEEDIRATVIGAGAYTTTLSGSTVAIDEQLLPRRNLPVVAVSGDSTFYEAVSTARELYTESGEFALFVAEIGSLTYDRITTVAKAIADAYEPVPESLPIIILTRQNCGKALGRTIENRVENPVAVLDELDVACGDYVDIGKPLRNGETVPVTIKTLAFGH